MPPKFVELASKCWSPDAHYRPQARNLDVMLTEMSAEDAEPITEDDRANKRRAGELLYDIFPKHVADALKEGKKIEPEKHDMVTVIFSDIVSFTDISRQIGPEKGKPELSAVPLYFLCQRVHFYLPLASCSSFKSATCWTDCTTSSMHVRANMMYSRSKQLGEYFLLYLYQRRSRSGFCCIL